ncbi:MAG: hypothetical protein PHX62_08660, partial [Bacilli bacterium]|nr:hypothetical protein [Bacilli bacterium]
IDECKDIIDLDIVNKYFAHILSIQDLDSYHILKCFEVEKGQVNYNFKEADEKFKLINNQQIPIIIPNEGNQKLIESLIYSEKPSNCLKKLQKDMVMVYEYEYHNLLRDRKIKVLMENVCLLVDEELYDSRKGLNIYYNDGFKDYFH